VEVQDAKSVVLSSAEAEYYSASEMAIEIIYLSTLLANMQLRQSDYTPVFEDNTVCIEWANHVIGGRELAKHIDICKHFTHEAVQNGHMRLYKIATGFQLADILTKALQLHQFQSYLHRLLQDVACNTTRPIKALVTRKAIFQPGIFYLETCWVS